MIGLIVIRIVEDINRSQIDVQLVAIGNDLDIMSVISIELTLMIIALNNNTTYLITKNLIGIRKFCERFYAITNLVSDTIFSSINNDDLSIERDERIFDRFKVFVSILPKSNSSFDLIFDY